MGYSNELENLIVDYYSNSEDFDVFNENDLPYIAKHLFTACVNALCEMRDYTDDNAVYCLTELGQNILRHDDLMEKYNNMTITVDEYVELLSLKEKLKDVD